MLVKESPEVGGEHLGLVDWDQGAAVIDPHELGVLEVIGQPHGVLGRHQRVLASPHDEYLPIEGALLLSPIKQLCLLRDATEVLVEVAADSRVTAQRLDPTQEQVVRDSPSSTDLQT